MIGIYKIENNITHLVYIGQSRNIEQRWHNHCSHINSARNDGLPLYRAFRKYGVENFSFSVVELCAIEELDEKEKFYIQKYNSFAPNGYNLTLGGQCSIPTQLSPEQVREIKELLKNSYLSQTQIAERFNVSQVTISDINIGSTWVEDIEYPIRTSRFLKAQPNKVYYCVDCGKEISKGAIRCAKCAKLFQRKVKRPSREELKQLIRTTPFTSIGQKFGVTDNTIRKWCKGYDLPTKKSNIKEYTDEQWEKI